jgi:peptidoglycan/LPS O-acetylase OafA/YrhL
MRYAPGLDGLRALAVTAVVLYHLNLLPGGFIGVDLFFVLSGFLITALLLFEHEETGRIGFRGFYLRRARRLLPALFALLAGAVLLTVVWRPSEVARLREDLAAALGYVTNWWLIWANDSYFGAGVHPPLLTHLWSLAVEEQFYLAWPIILALLLRRGNRRLTLGVPLAGVLASAALAAVLFDPWQDPSRVYYGTDTRAVAPLLGAALAIALRPWAWTDRTSSARRWTINTGGLAALFALAGVASTLTDRAPLLYRGGFLLVAALCGALVVVASHPAGWLARGLAVPPLRWLGDRTYAIYLWHWPLIALIGVGTIVRDVLIVALSLLMAGLSFHYVERPVRTGALLRAWRDRPRPLPGRHLAGLALGLLLVAGLGARLLTAVPVSNVPVGPGPAQTLGALAALPSRSASAPASRKASVAPARAPRAVPRVAVFGDSQGMTLLRNAPSDLGSYATFSDQTIEGCGILTGRVTSRTGERRDLTAACGGWLSQWRSNLARSRPQIALVMIGAWEVFDLTTADGKALTFGSPGWDANFSAALRQGTDVLDTAGARVALALLPCYRPIQGSAGYWPERGDDSRTRHINKLLRAAAAADPGHLSTVEPPAEYCTDPSIATNLNYRWDGVHFYKPGAALYLRTVLPELLLLH